MKKFLSFFLFLSVSMLLVPTNVFAIDKDRKEKAIIIVPGVLSSGLFYNGEKNYKYDENEVVWLGVGESKMGTIKSVGKLIMYYKDLFCDDNGIPVNDKIGPAVQRDYTRSPECDIAKYGILNSCKKLVNELDKNWGINNGGEYHIVLNSYDWRLSCAENAKLLTEKILKYDEVVLIGFSCGGLICCKSATELLAKKELSKIKAFISVGVPYQGAPSTLDVIENGMFNSDSAEDRNARFWGISDIIKEISHNCQSTYELLPTKNYFERGKGYICENSDQNLDYSQTLEQLRTRNWSKKKDGTNKDFYEKAEKFHEGLYVNGKHIVNFMNSYFIAGIGLKTISKILVNKASNDTAKVIEYADGDGTVPFYESAVPNGKTDEDIMKVNSKHNEILNDENALKCIVNIISKVKSIQTCNLAA
ncbi:MAG: hypothetical protein RUMPE_01183 [Eubacteriales bacterium SKADARSKE-1]|nr:hypothetical protein [Eubacteriales bacterium SKADARSKE-1]